MYLMDHNEQFSLLGVYPLYCKHGLCGTRFQVQMKLPYCDGLVKVLARHELGSIEL